MFIKLKRIDKLVLKKYYSWFFNLCVYIEFIKFNTYVFKVNEKSIRKVEFYFNKLHPLFAIFLLMYLPQLFVPIIGIFWYLDTIINLPAKDNLAIDEIDMSKRGKLKRALRALRREYLQEHPEAMENFPDGPSRGTRRAGKKNKKCYVLDPSLWTDEDWDEYYMHKYSGNSITYRGTSKTGDDLFAVKEPEPPANVKTWKGEVDNSKEEEIPDDELRIDNLYKSLQNGYIKSVERFFKTKCNIYPTDFGYALERINREDSRIYLDINFDYVKVWEGDNKMELLTSIIKELEKGFIQRTTKEELINVLDKYNIDITLVPDNKLHYLKKIYRVSCTPEELKLTKAKG